MEKVIIFSIFGFLFSLIGTKYLKGYLERKKEKPARSAGENFAKNKNPEILADLRFSKK